MVRPGRQVEDRDDAGDGESPAGLRTRQHDLAIRALRADQLRAGTRRGRRARTLCADEALCGPDAGRVSGLFTPLRVWTGRAPQPRLSACQPGAALPFPCPEQQSGDERKAPELYLA